MAAPLMPLLQFRNPLFTGSIPQKRKELRELHLLSTVNQKKDSACFDLDVRAVSAGGSSSSSNEERAEEEKELRKFARKIKSVPLHELERDLSLKSIMLSNL